MAWATSATAVTGAVAEAADFNNHRDNLNETAAGKAAAAGDTFYASAANALAVLGIGTAGQEKRVNAGATAPQWFTRDAQTADVTTSQTTSSASYADLATVGPEVTVTPGMAMKHLIMISCRANTDNASYGAYMSVAIAGAAAQDVDGAQVAGVTTIMYMSRHVLALAQASGATHTMKYKVANAAATGTFVNRRITAVPL